LEKLLKYLNASQSQTEIVLNNAALYNKALVIDSQNIAFVFRLSNVIFTQIQDIQKIALKKGVKSTTVQEMIESVKQKSVEKR